MALGGRQGGNGPRIYREAAHRIEPGNAVNISAGISRARNSVRQKENDDKERLKDIVYRDFDN